MRVKILRTFFGGYFPNYQKLIDKGYWILNMPKPLMIPIPPNHGFGKINGTTKKLGANYSPVPVCLFRRDNRQMIWETTSQADGSYFFRNIAVGLECFIVAFDPNEQYNAVIQDKITPYDGRLT